MISFQPKNIKSFLSALKLITELVDESYINLSPEGFKSSGTGPSRIMLYQIIYGDYQEEKGASFGFNSQDLDKILRRIRHPDSLVFSYNNNQIIIKAEEEGFIRTFRLKEIQVDYEELPFNDLMNLPFSIMITEKVNNIRKIIQDIMVYKEMISFDIRGKEMTCWANSVVGSIEIKKEINAKIISEKDFEVEFSAVFLDNIFKQIIGEVDILLGKGEMQGSLPLYISQKDEEKEIKIFLAPRV